MVLNATFNNISVKHDVNGKKAKRGQLLRCHVRQMQENNVYS